MPDFNLVAPVYDFLSRIVFGNSLLEAQVSLLKYIPPKSTVLIVGGGTGRILEEIARVHSSGLSIFYVENAAAMIALARKKDCKQNKLTFIHKNMEDWHTDQRFDVIITPFFFDLFTAEKVTTLFSGLDILLKEGGKWLYTDFLASEKHNRAWQHWLLKGMYFFFNVTSKVEARKLESMDPFFDKTYQKLKEMKFFHGFVVSAVYQKK